MKAIVQDVYGAAEVLQFRDIDPPVVDGDDDVLVAVVAAGVDRGAWHLMAGEPYLMRILGFGVRSPKNAVPGTNVAGRVQAVGTNVTRFQAGDEVYGTCRGAFAESACADESKLASKPTNLTFEEAAVVPYGCLAAWQAVHDHGHVKAGDRVLVVGATGAVGSFAVQFATVAGARVTGMCSARSFDYARSLGVDDVVDYADRDATAGKQFDVIIDVFGRTPVLRLRRALVPGGRLVIVGGEGGRWIGGIQRQLWAMLLSPFVSQHLGAFLVKEDAHYLDAVTSLIEAGRVTPTLDRTYPLADAASAVRDLQAPRKPGRLAVTM